MKFLPIIFLSLFLFSCGNDTTEKPVLPGDSSAKNDSGKNEVSKIPVETTKRIDSIVAEIKQKIAEGNLRKKVMSGGMKSLSGGFVYELFEHDTSLVYLYSDNGLEFGSSEIE